MVIDDIIKQLQSDGIKVNVERKNVFRRVNKSKARYKTNPYLRKKTFNNYLNNIKVNENL